MGAPCGCDVIRSKTIVPATAEHPTAAARALFFGGFGLKQRPLLLRLAARDLLGRLEARFDGEAVLREALLQQVRVDGALVVVLV